MTAPLQHPIPAQTSPRWGPTWAKVLAWIALVPAAWALFFGVAYVIQGFGEDALAALGLIVGPILAIFACAVALPAVLFLVRQRKSLFVVTMCVTPLLLLVVGFFTL